MRAVFSMLGGIYYWFEAYVSNQKKVSNPLDLLKFATLHHSQEIIPDLATQEPLIEKAQSITKLISVSDMESEYVRSLNILFRENRFIEIDFNMLGRLSESIAINVMNDRFIQARMAASSYEKKLELLLNNTLVQSNDVLYNCLNSTTDLILEITNSSYIWLDSLHH